MVKRKRYNSENDTDCDTALTQSEIDLISVYLSVSDLYGQMQPTHREILRRQLLSQYGRTIVIPFLQELFRVMETSQNDNTVHQTLQDLLDVSNLDNELLRTLGLNIETSIWTNNLVV